MADGRQPHQDAGQPQLQVRHRRPARATTCACRATRTGRASDVQRDRTSLNGGGLGLATFLLGDVTRLRRYVSANTDARERQWRHFYYAQDTWRVNSKLTLNYGLRLDVINPQTVNEAGQRRLPRPRTPARSAWSASATST